MPLCARLKKKRERAKLYMLRNKKENINTESGKMQRTYITNFGNKETFGMGKVFFPKQNKNHQNNLRTSEI